MSEWPRYRLIQRLLHWVTAVLIIPTLVLGATLGTLGFEGTVEAFGSQITNTLYVIHKTIGVLLIGLVAIRVIVRLVYGKPHYAIPLGHRWQKITSESVQALLYVGLIAMPLLGWAATATGGYPINFFQWVLPPLLGQNDALAALFFQLHGLFGWAMIGLVSVHIAASLYHWRIRRDGVMTRMSLIPGTGSHASNDREPSRKPQ